MAVTRLQGPIGTHPRFPSGFARFVETRREHRVPAASRGSRHAEAAPPDPTGEGF